MWYHISDPNLASTSIAKPMHDPRLCWAVTCYSWIPFSRSNPHQNCKPLPGAQIGNLFSMACFFLAHYIHIYSTYSLQHICHQLSSYFFWISTKDSTRNIPQVPSPGSKTEADAKRFQTWAQLPPHRASVHELPMWTGQLSTCPNSRLLAPIAFFGAAIQLWKNTNPNSWVFLRIVSCKEAKTKALSASFFWQWDPVTLRPSQVFRRILWPNRGSCDWGWFNMTGICKTTTHVPLQIGHDWTHMDTCLQQCFRPRDPKIPICALFNLGWLVPCVLSNARGFLTWGVSNGQLTRCQMIKHQLVESEAKFHEIHIFWS